MRCRCLWHLWAINPFASSEPAPRCPLAPPSSNALMQHSRQSSIGRFEQNQSNTHPQTTTTTPQAPPPPSTRLATKMLRQAWCANCVLVRLTCYFLQSAEVRVAVDAVWCAADQRKWRRARDRSHEEQTSIQPSGYQCCRAQFIVIQVCMAIEAPLCLPEECVVEVEEGDELCCPHAQSEV